MSHRFMIHKKSTSSSKKTLAFGINLGELQKTCQVVQRIHCGCRHRHHYDPAVSSYLDFDEAVSQCRARNHEVLDTRYLSRGGEGGIVLPGMLKTEAEEAPASHVCNANPTQSSDNEHSPTTRRRRISRTWGLQIGQRKIPARTDR